MKAPLIIGAGAVVLASGGAIVSATGANGGRVGFPEHASGVHPALRALLGAWDAFGTHNVVVAPADTDWTPSGGLRTDEGAQAAAAGAGLSNARTLQQTPHGRGAALDVWPLGFQPRRGFEVQPGMDTLMRVFGEWAEGQSVELSGLTYSFRWGGRFSSPDLPHVELCNWQQLPFPAPDYGEGLA